MAISIGDKVNWKPRAVPGSRINPIGFSGSRVVALGKSQDGEDAAMITGVDRNFGVLLSELELYLE